MASTRLTAAIKDVMTDKILHHAFAKKSAKLFQAELDFAQEIYTFIMNTDKVVINGKKSSMAKVLPSLPKSWVNHSYAFYCNFGSERVELNKYKGEEAYYNQNTKFIGLDGDMSKNKVPWEFSPSWTSRSSMIVFDDSDEKSKRLFYMRKAKDILFNEIAVARNTTRATLNSCTSIQKLVVMWPEIETFANEFLSEKKAAEMMLPTLERKKLNTTLGLPVGELK